MAVNPRHTLHRDSDQSKLCCIEATELLQGGRKERVTDPQSRSDALRLTVAEYDQTADAMLWIVPDGHIIHANDAACRSLRYSREHLLSLRVCDIDLHSSPDRWRQQWDEIRRSHSLVFESSYRTGDGTAIPVEVSANYQEIETKEYGCLVACDISQRRLSQSNHRLLHEIGQDAPFGSEWFEYLIENTLDIITVLGTDLRIRYASPSAERVLGYATRELLGMSAFDLVHPADTALVVMLVNEAYENPTEVRSAEVRLRHRDGSWRIQEAVGKRLPSSAPVPGLIVNLRDVTERHSAEHAKRERQERLIVQQDALVELATAEVVQSGDLENAVRHITEVTARTLAVERVSVWLLNDERSGIRCMDLFRSSQGDHASEKELRAADYPRYFAALESDRVIAADDARCDLRTREFAEAYLEPLGITSMLDAPVRLHGKLVGVVCSEQVGPPRHWSAEDQNFVGSVADMVSLALEAAQRKTTEQALRRSEAQYRALFQHATYGMYRSTPEGRFLAVNPALVQMLGYDSEGELLEIDLARDIYTGPNERATLIDRHGSAPVRGVEVDWKRKDGTVLNVRLSGRTVCREDGAIDYFEMMAEDITERRKLEGQLRQAQKMEAIGQLTGGITHDFNNMLSIVLANAEMVAASLGPDQTALLADVREMQAAAQKTARMVRRLLGYSRHAELSLVPTDLGSVVDNLSSMLSRVLPENIEVQVATKPVGTVEADAGAVEQMLLNLATNARDAMPQGGILRIKVHDTELDESRRAVEPWIKPGAYVCITVSDTGVGMDRDTKDRVFEPFFTTKPTGVGTGLGMAMVYGLAKQHGGFVHVYSEIGQGSVFRLYFPIVAGAVNDCDAASPVTELVGGSETILLVEDEEALRRSGKRVLERFGYTVLTATDGQEGLELYSANSSRIDLVISDLVMPRISGWQLYQSLTQQYKSLRFLMASGYSQAEAGRAPPGAQVPFVHKPWTLRDLLVRVRQVLDG